MILGILDADTLSDQLRPRYHSYTQMMINLFAEVPHSLQLKTYHVNAMQFPEKDEACDAYLITGSKSACYEQEPWILRLGDFVQRAYQNRIPLIGICFGHQLLAHHLGGHCGPAVQGWGLGVQQYQVSASAQKGLSLPAEINLLASHYDQVQSLPTDAMVIAHNDFCPNAACWVPGRLLSFQGHPEFTPAFADALMQGRKQIIPAKAFTEGQDTLNNPTQHLTITRCILDFVAQNC
ncbi:MAG: GMP synthase [Alteromonadaceae bacterium]|nr:MAG: GMP synthase [Alteromonadaceae bacterium]